MNLTTSYLLCHGLISFLSPYNFIRGIDKTTTNDGNARRVRLKGKSNDMELSGVGASERELDFVSDERAERFLSLGAADVTPDKSKVRQSLMSSGSLESRTGSVFRPAVSVTQNMGSKTEFVLKDFDESEIGNGVEIGRALKLGTYELLRFVLTFH